MNSNAARYWIGLIFVLFGVLFIFKNFNIPFFNRIDVFQFLIPILLLFWAFESYRKGRQVLALILGLIGTSMAFDAVGLHFLGFDLLAKLIVPGILILIGYQIINRPAGKNNSGTKTKPDNTYKGYYSPGAEVNTGAEEVITHFGPKSDHTDQTYQQSQSPNENQSRTRNRIISSVFSSQRRYFTKNDFSPGNSYIDATCVFGDLDLIFTPDINLHIDANVTLADLNFLGRKVDGIMNKFQEDYQANSSDVHVYIAVSVVFGDIDILHLK